MTDRPEDHSDRPTNQLARRITTIAHRRADVESKPTRRVCLKHPYSAGDLWPGPNTVRMAGLRVRVMQFRIGDIARVERDLEGMAGDPTRDVVMPYLAKVREAREAGDRRLSSRWVTGLMTHGAASWPPRVGGNRAAELLGTERGAIRYLWHALRRNHPALTIARCGELVRSMGVEDWRRLEDILWGRKSYEVAPPASSEGKRLALGRDWGRLAQLLMASYSMGPDDVRRLYVSQAEFLLAASDEKKTPVRETWVETPTEAWGEYPPEPGVTDPPPDDKPSPPPSNGSGTTP